MDPSIAIKEILEAFNESRNRVHRWKAPSTRGPSTLISSDGGITKPGLQRRTAHLAIEEARDVAVAISMQLKAEIMALRQQIAVLQDEAAKRTETNEKSASIGCVPDWRKQLTTALERFTKTEAVKSHCEDLEATVSSAREENRLLKRKLEKVTKEAATAASLREEAELSESSLRDKYDTQKTTIRELKYACSELNAAQAELSANAAAHERLALEAVQEKADADTTLQELQSRYDELKLKKKCKTEKAVRTSSFCPFPFVILDQNCGDHFTQIEALTADVSALTGDLAKAKKLVKNASAEALVQLQKVYREQKEINKELQRKYDRLEADNKGLKCKYISLEKDVQASFPPPIRDQYDELNRSQDRLKATCNDLEAQNTKLRQDCRNLWTQNNELEKTCAQVINVAENMDTEATQLRSAMNDLRNESRALEDQVRNFTAANEVLERDSQSMAFGGKRKLDEISQ
ncbi:hypothetical protein B0H17DRAFT_1339479 [Mycena rosella]|uniref:Uncharacterized protein n=1 Tax=Mycena rosella TaxID=1033263 RepID=A0AAD7FQI0_MYCRO|nr:hypothetical protein B0H17DRAFT_1339479 [Mycena rosella]